MECARTCNRMCSRSEHVIPSSSASHNVEPPSYTEFVQISKEVSVIENEMLEFKDCLSEWKNMPSLLHVEESASAAGICAVHGVVHHLIRLYRASSQRPIFHRRPSRTLRQPDADAPPADRGLQQVCADDARTSCRLRNGQHPSSERGNLQGRSSGPLRCPR